MPLTLEWDLTQKRLLDLGNQRKWGQNIFQMMDFYDNPVATEWDFDGSEWMQCMRVVVVELWEMKEQEDKEVVALRKKSWPHCCLDTS